HGMKILDAPKKLLAAAGFTVLTPAEAHLCCGSAGVYNILQPKIADELRDRKARNLQRLRPDVIAAGNIGCLTQIGSDANAGGPYRRTRRLGARRPGADRRDGARPVS